MIDGILGIKQSTIQDFEHCGKRVPVTVVLSGPNLIVQLKTEEKDGYSAVQLGFGAKRIKNITKPVLGHLRQARGEQKKTPLCSKSYSGQEKGAEKEAPRFLKEVRFGGKEGKTDYKVGDVVQPSDVFKEGDLVSVTGLSKGKGFQGVVKRWGFAGGPASHGGSSVLRSPGSIGQGTTPGRVFKGKKMPGRMGGVQATQKNLKVVGVDGSTGQLRIAGLVPGAKGSLLLLRKAS